MSILEEAFGRVRRQACVGKECPDCQEAEAAARALAMTTLEEMALPCCGVLGEDDPAWCGNPACLQAADLRRQIEELGR